MEIEKKIIAPEKLESLSQQLKANRKKIVTTNGCFDFIHYGHLHYLKAAKGLGDVLVVGINSDASVKRLKGEDRPIFGEQVRAYQLACLSFVDYVTIFDESTPLEFIRTVRPARHCKGADYEGKDIPEKKLLAELGGEMCFMEYLEGYSTTSLLEKIKNASQS